MNNQICSNCGAYREAGDALCADRGDSLRSTHNASFCQSCGAAAGGGSYYAACGHPLRATTDRAPVHTSPTRFTPTGSNAGGPLPAPLPAIALAISLFGAALVCVGVFQPWMYGFTPSESARWLPVVFALAAVALTATGLGGRVGLTAWSTTPAFAIIVLAQAYLLSDDWSIDFASVARGLWMVLSGGVILTIGTIIGQVRPETIDEPAERIQRWAA